jgi:hypothetical protein
MLVLGLRVVRLRGFFANAEHGLAGLAELAELGLGLGLSLGLGLGLGLLDLQRTLRKSYRSSVWKLLC